MKVHMTKEDYEAISSRQTQLCQMNAQALGEALDKILLSIPDPESSQWQWSLTFMKSMLSQFNSRIGGRDPLSHKQLHYVAKIEKEIELFPSHQTAEGNFKKEYLQNKQMQADLAQVVEYYSKTQYYSSLVREYNKNKNNCDWSPTKQTWDRAIVGNKYVQRLLDATKTPDKFVLGQFVTLRSGVKHRSSLEKVQSTSFPDRMISRVYKTDDLFMVLEYEREKTVPKKGGKSLKLLAVGTQDVFSMHECNLKKVKVK